MVTAENLKNEKDKIELSIQLGPQVRIDVLENTIEVLCDYSSPSVLSHSTNWALLFRDARFDKERHIWVLLRNLNNFTSLDCLFGVDFHGENPMVKAYVMLSGLGGYSDVVLNGYVLIAKDPFTQEFQLGKGVKKVSGDFFTHDDGCLVVGYNTVLEIDVPARLAHRRGLLTQKPDPVLNNSLSCYGDQQLLDEVKRRGLSVTP